MATVKQHYDNVLSDVYSWMYGGFEHGIKQNTAFIEKHQLVPQGSGIALDLGAGCGFQSIPLASAGYTVTALDIDAKLLNELKENAGDLPITTAQADLINFKEYLKADAELVVCMTDTLLHLESKEKVILLFEEVFAALEAGGKFVITFRDLTYELQELDRILPVRSDENTIFTCFLEYEPQTVKVHDIVYRNLDGNWHLSKSFYRKLRLSEQWVKDHLEQAGFSTITSTVDKGLVTMIAGR